MKLFDVVGITSFNTNFYIRLASHQKETEEYYAWALDNVKSLYMGISYSPVIAISRDNALVNAVRHVLRTSHILLCTWHVNKNLAKNCKSMFETGERNDYFFKQWELFLYAGTSGEFDERWNSLKICFGETSDLVKYLENTWVCHKDLLILCWANQFLHLGSHFMSRVEGAHITPKNYLDNSIGDLMVLKEKISLAIDKQQNQISEQVATEQVLVPIQLNKDFFSNVIRKISRFALLKIKKEFEGSLEPIQEECMGYY